MKKKIHGRRNQALSIELFSGNKYYDWVITTAFYAAIHYVEDKILPKTINGIHCKSLNDVKKAYVMSGRHQARERLVFENLPLTCAAKYKWLDDQSRNSRYVTYKISKPLAEKALEYLEVIHAACYQAE